jgi:hypothetical protein
VRRSDEGKENEISFLGARPQERKTERYFGDFF